MGFLKYLIIIMGLVPPIDYCARRAKARADVATLRVVLDEVKPTKPKDTHVINITNKKALTATEFKQMFYARGDNHFCIANIYECPNNANSILASVWGKRVDSNPYNPYSRVVNFNKLGGGALINPMELIWLMDILWIFKEIFMPNMKLWEI